MTQVDMALLKAIEAKRGNVWSKWEMKQIIWRYGDARLMLDLKSFKQTRLKEKTTQLHMYNTKYVLEVCRTRAKFQFF